MFAWDDRKGLKEVRPKFVRSPSFARKIPRDGESAAERGIGIFEPAYVVALPTMKRNRDARKLNEGFGDIDAQFSVAFLGQRKCAFDMFCGVGHKRFRGKTLGS